MGGTWLNALARYAGVIAPEVTENILERHLRPLFIEGRASL
jgi:hypothetical protein